MCGDVSTNELSDIQNDQSQGQLDCHPVQNVQLDHLDARLILELSEDPRLGVMELAHRLGVARGTAQARLNKLQDT